MKHHLLLLLAMLTMFGCSQIEEPVREKTAETEEPQVTETARTRAGASAIESPYSLSTVQQAYNALRPSLGLPAKTLAATDHYVKFYVADSVQYLTMCDLDVEMFEYPLPHLAQV